MRIDWKSRLGENPEIGVVDRPVPCDECQTDESRLVVTRHTKRVCGYSLCEHCLKVIHYL